MGCDRSQWSYFLRLEIIIFLSYKFTYVNLYRSNHTKLFFFIVYIALRFFRCILANRRDIEEGKDMLDSELISSRVKILALYPLIPDVASRFTEMKRMRRVQSVIVII